MTETPNPAVTISVDLKKYRIRIYKSMLRLLGDPPYIQLLVNPDNKCVAIRAVEKAVIIRHKILKMKAPCTR